MQKNLFNQRFGRLVALEKHSVDKHRKTIWKCKCDCGNISYPISSNLLKGTTTSCGCLHKEIVSKTKQANLIGNKYYCLSVVKKHSVKNKQVWWECLCDCGKSSYVTTNNLNSGAIKSCGNCQLKRNGVTTSYRALEIHKIIGKGIHNFKTYIGPIVDIALVDSGNKIAIEYDEWYWHGSRQDKDNERINLLIKNGWKVLNIKANKNIPSKEELLSHISLLKTQNRVDLILQNWGIGEYR